MAPTIPAASRLSPPSSSSCSSSSSDSNPGPIVVSSSDEAASNRSRKGPRNQRWLLHDEVKILTVLSALRKERATGQLPTPVELCRALRDDADLKRENLTASDLSKKMYNLRRKFSKAVSDGARPRGRRDKMLFELSKEVWPKLLPVTITITTSDDSE